MKAIVCTRYGPPEVLQIGDAPRPTPQQHQVCIRIGATAVTSSDCYIRGLIYLVGIRLLLARLTRS